ncbi:TIR domain-containing protein [Sphaerospermopsis sp. LEGE 08334]|jgi:hypothetical protein|uniref:TIR domain-containing protein n=1 Tax=Sphaerospermopsis sp. LEGE 08334 TaxID=1828651 RepID=UPI0018804150|nr:TIR domain-containing protein [Sphaerospermopsis sp. LEGE 08334]MBE9056799.1 TIR domain-containing protein [Sphaerospermopsis sp. LEGE 08334]
MNSITRRKVFISYHHVDQAEVQEFINTFDHERNVFIRRALGVDMADDIINSTDTDYVMRRIRENYLNDSTVTICLIGQCTWARRYVDWEIQASLRHNKNTLPNGLLGIILPSASKNFTIPERLAKNILGENNDEGYACCYHYPQRKDSLANLIEKAYQARFTKTHLINNPPVKFLYNRTCP